MPPERPNWERIDLSAPELAIVARPPAWCGLIYAGKRHWLSGPPETAKTMLGWIVALEVHRTDGPVAQVDFESGAAGTRLVLHELGATLEEIRQVIHFEPTGPPQASDIDALVAEGVQLVIVDAVAGAFDITGLDDNKRADVEAFARIWTKPFYDAGVATLVIDHVGKNRENRGSFAIGSERKVGVADVHLGLESVKTLSRGGHGLVKINVHKDRPGFLRRPTCAELELHSDPDTHALTWTLQQPEQSADGAAPWQPTFLMQRVSDYLAEKDEPVSMAEVERNVTGKSREWRRKAIEALISGGYITEQTGPRNARMLTLARPYPTTSDDLSPPLPTSPGEDASHLSHLSHPLQGGEVTGEDNDELERLAALGHELGVA